MNTKEKTCAERIEQELADREEQLKKLYEVIDNQDDSDGEAIDEALAEINNFSYGIDTLKIYRVIWSGGGPSDELQITCTKDGEIYLVEYIYKDWFDGARKEVKEGSAVWRYAEGIVEMMEA